MSLLKKVKQRVGEYMLGKDMAPVSRERSVFNFEQARSFGLLFDASNPENYELVQKYLKYLRDSKKKVKAVAYFNNKNANHTELSKLDYDFFTNKDVNWYGKPHAGFVESFINEPFDVLINFSVENSFPLMYLSGVSKAKFKIGLYTANIDIYDMMIEHPQDKSFKFFMRQVDHYLGIINKPNN